MAKRNSKRGKADASTPAADKCASIYDLARQTGLSTSTVSRALNQRGRISQKTRVRVLTAAREAGFKPRASVRLQTVALVIDRMRFSSYGGFIPSLLAQLMCELGQYEISAEVYTEDNVSRLGTRFVDGVIAVAWDPTTVAKLLKLKNVPVIIMNRLDVEGVSTVVSDHFQGGKLAGDYFIANGHKKIAFLGEERDWGSQHRINGLRASLSENGLDPDSLCIGFTEHQPVYGALRRLAGQKPTGLLLGGEDLTIESMHVLGTILGIKVPNELSVIGYELAKVSQFVQPPLTCIAQPLDHLASEAMRLLMRLMDGQAVSNPNVVVDNTIVERESVAALAT